MSIFLICWSNILIMLLQPFRYIISTLPTNVELIYSKCWTKFEELLNLVPQDVEYNSLTWLMFSMTKIKVNATGSKCNKSEKKILPCHGLMDSWYCGAIYCWVNPIRAITIFQILSSTITIRLFWNMPLQFFLYPAHAIFYTFRQYWAHLQTVVYV